MSQVRSGKFKLSWRQWVIVGFVGLLAISLLIGRDSKDGGGSDTGPRLVSSEESAESNKSKFDIANEDSKKSKWTNFETTDELRGSRNKFSTVTSLNSAKFAFPYCCDSRLKISVRETKQYGEDVIFQISDGQFKCGLYGCSGMISFDGNAENLTLSTPESGSSKVLFAKYPKPIIKKLKSSEITIVELPFYKEGPHQFRFETFGLEWD